MLTHQTHCSDSLLLERRPYQTHQKRTRRHEIRRMRQKKRTGRMPWASSLNRKRLLALLQSEVTLSVIRDDV